MNMMFEEVTAEVEDPKAKNEDGDSTNTAAETSPADERKLDCARRKMERRRARLEAY